MNQIKFGAIISYIALFVNVLIGLLYTPWLISTIGKSDYGLYTLALSIISLLAFDFGLGNATTKFITQYLAEKNQEKVDNLLGLIYKLYIGIDILLLLVFTGIYFFLPEIYTGLNENEISRFSVVFLIAAVFCLISFPNIPQNGILKSYEKFVQVKSCDLFNRVFIVITMSVCLLNGFGLYTLILVNSISGLITIVLKQIIISRYTPISVSLKYWNIAEVKVIITFTVWVTIAALSQRMIFAIAPSILGIFSNSTEIAILGVAITIESFVYLFADALNGMFLPRVSRMLADNDTDHILELMIKIGRIQIFIIGFIIIWIVSFGNAFVDVWIGDNYEMVLPCLILIVLPSFLHLPQEIGLTYLIAANKVKFQAYIYICMGLINILLGIPLSSQFGSIGICCSIFIAYIFRTVSLDFVFKKSLHLDILRFFKESYFKLIIPLGIVLVVSILVAVYIPLSGWLGLIVKSACSFFIYLLVIGKFCTNAYERNLVSQVLKLR